MPARRPSTSDRRPDAPGASEQEDAGPRSPGELSAAIVESADDAIVAFRLDGTVMSWNPGATRTLGYTAEEAIGRSIFDLACPFTRESLERMLEEVAESDHTRHYDKACQRKDGETIRVSLRVSPLLDGEGNVEGVAAIIRDMAAHQQLYYGLIGSERRFRQLVEDSGDIIVRMNEAGRVLYVNPVAEKLLGFPAEELVGRDSADLVRADFRDGVRRFYRQQFLDRTPTTYLEFPVVTAAGHSLWLGLTSQLVMRAGRLQAMQGVARDVSAQRAAEESLRLLSDVSRTLSSSLSSSATARQLATLLTPRFADLALVYFFPGDGVAATQFGARAMKRTLARSEDFSRLLGANGAELTELLWSAGSHIYHLEDSGAPSPLPPRQAAALRAVGLGSLLVTAIAARGQSIGTLLLGRAAARAPFTGADLVVAGDIAQNAALALENARLFERAQQAVTARDQMLAVVSHDLRNPLSALRMGTAGLLRHGRLAETDPERKQLLSMQRAAEHMRRLIQDLLDVTRMESGGFVVNTRPTSADALLSAAEEALAPLVEERTFRIHSTWVGAPPLLQVDSERIVQVLTNLVSNAVRFTHPGGRIEVEAGESDGGVSFRVADGGAGIPTESLPRIFDRFYQVENDSRGAGLGLAIARGIVEAHGGTIEVTSTVGEGTTFTVTLPLAVQ